MHSQAGWSVGDRDRFFAALYPVLRKRVLTWETFPAVTVPEFLKLNLWIVIILIEGFMIGVLVLLEYLGFVKLRITILFLRAVLPSEFHSFLNEGERLYRTFGGTVTIFK